MRLLFLVRLLFAAAIFGLFMVIAAVKLVPTEPEEQETSMLQTVSNIKVPKTPFNFSKIFEGPGSTLDTDRSTFSAIVDQDGDTIVGGIFRITRKNPQPGEMATAVMLTVGVCGYDGIIVIHTKNFQADGKLIEEQAGAPQPMKISPGSPAEASYKVLCGSNTKPTPVDPSYKAPDSYTKFWT